MKRTKCSDRLQETEYKVKNTTPTVLFVLMSWKRSKKSKIQLIEKNKKRSHLNSQLKILKIVNR
jgi:hypothetical protein